mmetsp:Transcript_25736/g.29412  ORF Transcript_25736/g.29412 Transcript_25736/m.29412 type:complete len:183 (-) Transcript_25736:29-577(-)
MLSYMMSPVKLIFVVTVATVCFCTSPALSFGLNNNNNKSKTKKKTGSLPVLDKAANKYIPPSNLSSAQFYSPVSTIIKAGPVPVLTRFFQSETYEQAVWKYMVESKDTDVKSAQGNMDAFFASKESWVEQKMFEKQGKREVYDYGQEPSLDRVILASIWGVLSTSLILRVLWQLANGNRNLF